MGVRISVRQNEELFSLTPDARISVLSLSSKKYVEQKAPSVSKEKFDGSRRAEQTFPHRALKTSRHQPESLSYRLFDQELCDIG